MSAEPVKPATGSDAAAAPQVPNPTPQVPNPAPAPTPAAASELTMFGAKAQAAGGGGSEAKPDKPETATANGKPDAASTSTAAPSTGTAGATGADGAVIHSKPVPKPAPIPAPAHSKYNSDAKPHLSSMSQDDQRAAEASSGSSSAAQVFAQIKKETIDPYIAYLHDGTAFDFEHYKQTFMSYYDAIFTACSAGLQEVNPQAFYQNYQETLEGFVITSCAPKMEKAVAKAAAANEVMDESVLAEFKSVWDKHQMLVRHLVKMFLYLDRCTVLIEQRVLPLKDQGHHVFKTKLFDHHNIRIRDALIKGLNIPADKQTPEQKKLIDDTKALLLEIGKAFGDLYIQNMERMKEVAALKSHLTDMFTDTHRLLLQEAVEPQTQEHYPRGGGAPQPSATTHSQSKRDNYRDPMGGNFGPGGMRNPWDHHGGGGGGGRRGPGRRGGGRGGGGSDKPIPCQACTMMNPEWMEQCATCESWVIPLEARDDYGKHDTSKQSGAAKVMGGGGGGGGGGGAAKASDAAPANNAKQPEPAPQPKPDIIARPAPSAAPPASAAAPAADSVWVCKACTFRNPAAFATCNMCESPKG